LNTGALTSASASDAAALRSDAERLSHIIMEMQRCFVLHLCKELAPGGVSFPQFFLLAALDQREVLTMSAIAQKMGHTTAAASGLVARLENLGYVVRSSAAEDRRKVMVCITPKGSALVRRIREEMVGNLIKMMGHLSVSEQKAWLQIYSKIYNLCQSKDRARGVGMMPNHTAHPALHVSPMEPTRPARGTTRRCASSRCVA
jgi:DNA-binding MarR family transcriptional regulator